ncbi:MAG: HAMP domain-containing histidine kinase [Lachnospiraceae bacterium]|nr:HAMP domain-containing histidine kinase [Lachnospiraceae bacterium]
MIKKLQARFILISMLSMVLVLTVIMSSVNFLNYQKVVTEADHVLRFLSEHKGKFPPLPPQETADRKPLKPQEGKNPNLFHMTPEMPYETRYFSVLLTENGNLISTDTKKIAAIDAKTASDYAARVWSSKETSGFLSCYRYLKETSSENIQITFLDCSRDLDTFRSFLVSSILVSLLGLCSVLCLVLVFSKIVMKPISESYEKQRRFITDAGHELKTPVTIINANREILELEYGENEWSQGIQKQTARLTDLTNQLIFLSRMEEPERRLQKIEFCISDLAEEAVQSFQAPAATQNKTLTSDITPLLPFYGDEASIRQLLYLLLDNAVKYSPPSGSIELTLKKRGKNICLTVYNTSNPVSKEHLSRLFDRFYRTDASRNSETGGCGIGLSLARAITDAHKGKISAESKDGVSLLITVSL